MYTLQRSSSWKNIDHSVGMGEETTVWFHDHQHGLALQLARTGKSRSTSFDTLNGGINEDYTEWFGPPRYEESLPADTREIEEMHEFNGEWDLTFGNDFSYVLHTCELPPNF